MSVDPAPSWHAEVPRWQTCPSHCDHRNTIVMPPQDLHAIIHATRWRHGSTPHSPEINHSHFVTFFYLLFKLCTSHKHWQLLSLNSCCQPGSGLTSLFSECAHAPVCCCTQLTGNLNALSIDRYISAYCRNHSSWHADRQADTWTDSNRDKPDHLYNRRVGSDCWWLSQI